MDLNEAKELKKQLIKQTTSGIYDLEWSRKYYDVLTKELALIEEYEAKKTNILDLPVCSRNNIYICMIRHKTGEFVCLKESHITCSYKYEYSPDRDTNETSAIDSVTEELPESSVNPPAIDREPGDEVEETSVTEDRATEDARGIEQTQGAELTDPGAETESKQGKLF